MGSFTIRRHAAATFAALALAGGMSACGSDDEPSDTGASAPSSTTATSDAAGIYAEAKRKVEELTSVQPTPELPALPSTPPTKKTVIGVNCALPTCVPDAGAAQAKTLGWKFERVPIDVTKGPSDAVRALNQAIAAKPDFIYFKSLYSMEPLKASLAKAKSLDIPVVQYAGDSGAENIVGCVNCDPEYEEVGRVLTQVALADAGKATGIAFVCDQNYTPLQQLNRGFDELAKKGASSGSSFDRVNVDITKPPAEVAQTVVNFVRREPETQYVIACIPEVATALPQALSQAGLSSKTKLIYGSPHPQELAAVKAGRAFAAVPSEAEFSSWRGFDMMARIAVGEEVPEDLRNPVGWMQVITKANADEFDDTLQPKDIEGTFAKLWQKG